MVLLTKIPYLQPARNAEHDYLFDKIVNSIPLAFATEHNFQAYHTRMTDALAEEHRSYTQTTKSVDTATLIDKDAVRDKRYRRLKLTVEAAELDADAETAASGAKCLIAFGTANLAALPYAEETAAVRDLVEKLESDEYATHVEAIGATQALADLKAANDDFDATYSGRAAERYARDTATLSSKEARVAMEKAYYEVMDILNAIYIQSAILEPDADTAAEVREMADAINAHIGQFTLNLARRGVGSATAPEGEEPADPSETPDPEQPEPTDPEEPGGETESPDVI